MLSIRRSLCALPPIVAALWMASLLAAQSHTLQKAGQKDAKPDLTRGKEFFASTCAGCHGLDGRGGERAPNIVERRNVQRLSDEQIFRIVQNGVPGTGMPAFRSLESFQIKSVVAYLRTLQGPGKTAFALPGDANRGKTIFFGKAECSRCHMVSGEGGFIASDLSEYARAHDVAQVRDAITKPVLSSKLAAAILRTGEKYVGRVRNEDNFSLQLQTLDGAFHFLSKSDIESLSYDSQTLMPSDYASRLTSAELNDLISFLMTVAGRDTPATHKNTKEWDD